MFKNVLVLLSLLAGASAFAPRTWVPRTTALQAERINTKIDLESKKVATTDTVEAGEKKVYCRCWKSGTFPLCDAAHVAHNKECDDNVGPLIVAGPKK
mmetsp:Transcript_24639/g.55502  ORF Transcript_24639/g.55502 Transcript_24639/m.55502 type:complete len:98 (+) Transcript_24639:31-324(+)